MKKKLLNTFILVLSFFAFVFVITSCDNNSSTNSNPSTNSDNSVNPGTTDDSSTKTDEQVNTGDDDNVYYTITWKNYDGEVIKTETVKYGTNPIYNGDTPMRPSDQEYQYVFLKWDKFFSPVTSNVEYTAIFRAIPY